MYQSVRTLVMLGAYFRLLCATYRLVRKRRLQNRRWWVRPILRDRQRHGDFNNMFRELRHTDHEEFYQYVRMTPGQFDQLHFLVAPLLKKKSHRTPLSTELRLAVLLSYLAHGDSARTKAWQFRIGKSTMHKLIGETSQAIWEALQPIYLNTNGMNWKQIQKEFWEKWNFPNCVGAIDGKHVRLQAPPRSGSLYHNYKSSFSIVLMATCDAQYRFTWVDIGDCGSNNDAGIYSHSDFANSLENGTFELPPPQTLPGTEIVTPVAFVGDEAFPLKTYLMKPFPRRNLLSNQQRVFNYRLSRARRVIENTFGILVSRWRILRGNICCKLSTAEAIIQALVCLHNFLMTAETRRPPNERRYLTHGLVDEEGQDGATIPGEWRQDPFPGGILQRRGRMGANFAAAAANQQRECLSDYFVMEAGAVPWQWNKI